MVAGGAGSAVNELLLARGMNTAVLNLGLPDRFPAQGNPDHELASYGLDADGIVARCAHPRRCRAASAGSRIRSPA